MKTINEIISHKFNELIKLLLIAVILILLQSCNSSRITLTATEPSYVSTEEIDFLDSVLKVVIANKDTIDLFIPALKARAASIVTSKSYFSDIVKELGEKVERGEKKYKQLKIPDVEGCKVKTLDDYLDETRKKLGQDTSELGKKIKEIFEIQRALTKYDTELIINDSVINVIKNKIRSKKISKFVFDGTLTLMEESVITDQARIKETIIEYSKQLEEHDITFRQYGADVVKQYDILRVLSGNFEFDLCDSWEVEIKYPECEFDITLAQFNRFDFEDYAHTYKQKLSEYKTSYPELSFEIILLVFGYVDTRLPDSICSENLDKYKTDLYPNKDNLERQEYNTLLSFLRAKELKSYLQDLMETKIQVKIITCFDGLGTKDPDNGEYYKEKGEDDRRRVVRVYCHIVAW